MHYCSFAREYRCAHLSGSLPLFAVGHAKRNIAAWLLRRLGGEGRGADGQCKNCTSPEADHLEAMCGAKLKQLKQVEMKHSREKTSFCNAVTDVANGYWEVRTGGNYISLF